MDFLFEENRFSENLDCLRNFSKLSNDNLQGPFDQIAMPYGLQNSPGTPNYGIYENNSFFPALTKLKIFRIFDLKILDFLLIFEENRFCENLDCLRNFSKLSNDNL